MWSVSAFERLHIVGYPSVMLDVQNRSHARLYAPTSEAFYDGQVRSARMNCSMSVDCLFDGAVTVQWNNCTWRLPRGLGWARLPATHPSRSSTREKQRLPSAWRES